MPIQPQSIFTQDGIVGDIPDLFRDPVVNLAAADKLQMELPVEGKQGKQLRGKALPVRGVKGRMNFIDRDDAGDAAGPGIAGSADHIEPVRYLHILPLIAEVRRDVNVLPADVLDCPFHVRDHGKSLAFAGKRDITINAPKLPGLKPEKIDHDPADEIQPFKRDFKGIQKIDAFIQYSPDSGDSGEPAAQLRAVTPIPAPKNPFPVRLAVRKGKQDSLLLQLRHTKALCFFKLPLRRFSVFCFLCHSATLREKIRDTANDPVCDKNAEFRHADCQDNRHDK